jgi:hypothetical protein
MCGSTNASLHPQVERQILRAETALALYLRRPQTFALVIGASRQNSPFLIAQMMTLVIRRSSTRGMPCDIGK